MKVSIKLNSEKLYQKLEKAIENFKDEESKQLNDVDIGKCSDDYITALLIFDQTLFTTKVID
jgi:hypothetical protein